jgi:hypothetical protein
VQDLKLPFAITHGRVASNDAVMKTALGEWHITGSAGFDGTLDYAMSGTVPKTLVSSGDLRSALAAGGLTNANGDVLLDLHLGGTTKAPRVALDARSMAARVQGRLSEALADQKSKLHEQLTQGIVSQTTAGADSAGRVQAAHNAQALIDSLRKKKGSDILKSFFGGAKKDTTPR